MSNSLRFYDKFLAATLFKILPRFAGPDFFTMLRFVCIPVVLLLAGGQMFSWALAVFILAVIFDVLDGSLARTGSRVSEWGKIMDPAADKLLTILSCLFLAFFYPQPIILILAAVSDVMIIFAAFFLFMIFSKHRFSGADVFGKLKMFVESVGLVLVFLFLIFGGWWYLPSLVVMFAAMVLGFLSFLAYGIRFIRSK